MLSGEDTKYIKRSRLAAVVPEQYNIVCIACDKYKNFSFKNGKCSLGGYSDKFVIRGEEVRIPSDFKKCLSDRDNKERMFELIKQVWI